MNLMHLRDYMAEHDLNDADVAAAIGVQRETVLRYRHGTLTPRLQMMHRIAQWSNGKVSLDSWLSRFT